MKSENDIHTVPDTFGAILCQNLKSFKKMLGSLEFLLPEILMTHFLPNIAHQQPKIGLISQVNPEVNQYFRNYEFNLHILQHL